MTVERPIVEVVCGVCQHRVGNMMVRVIGTEFFPIWKPSVTAPLPGSPLTYHLQKTEGFKIGTRPIDPSEVVFSVGQEVDFSDSHRPVNVLVSCGCGWWVIDDAQIVTITTDAMRAQRPKKVMLASVSSRWQNTLDA